MKNEKSKMAEVYFSQNKIRSMKFLFQKQQGTSSQNAVEFVRETYLRLCFLHLWQCYYRHIYGDRLRSRNTCPFITVSQTELHILILQKILVFCYSDVFV